MVDDKYFAMPCEKKMTFDQFLDGMPIRTRKKDSPSGKSEQDSGLRERTDLETFAKEKLDLEGSGHDRNQDPYQEVRYIQLQNGNLMTEYQELMDDVPADIPFASEALGKVPDAVNFWYGDERSTTSLHKGKSLQDDASCRMRRLVLIFFVQLSRLAKTRILT